jgi:hypothetical protein
MAPEGFDDILILPSFSSLFWFFVCPLEFPVFLASSSSSSSPSSTLLPPHAYLLSCLLSMETPIQLPPHTWFIALLNLLIAIATLLTTPSAFLVQFLSQSFSFFMLCCWLSDTVLFLDVFGNTVVYLKLSVCRCKVQYPSSRYLSDVMMEVYEIQPIVYITQVTSLKGRNVNVVSSRACRTQKVYISFVRITCILFDNIKL